MSKYYTPEIEEFHVGFRFEWFSNYYGQKEHKWHTVCKGTGLESPWDSVEEYLKNNEIRVKYLDKEDIESFGFVQYKVPWQYRYMHYKLHTAVHNIKESIPQDRITILDSRDSHCYFDGIIKNKSELKKVLQQIGIL